MHFSLHIFLQRIRLYLEYEQIAQVSDQVRHQPHHVLAGITLLMQQINRVRSFTSQNPPGKIDHRLFACESKNIEHIVLADFLSAKRDELIEHRFRIAQTALGSTRDRMRSRGLERDFFFSSDELQMFRYEICRDTVKIESLTPAQNGGQHFLRLGRRENKFHMPRRLFESL